MAEAGTLHDAFIDELRDTYDAEKQLTKALPKLAKAATSQELRTAFESHLEETRGHVERLEQVFESLDEKVRGKHCDGHGRDHRGRQVDHGGGLRRRDHGCVPDRRRPAGRALRDGGLRDARRLGHGHGPRRSRESAPGDSRRREGGGQEADARWPRRASTRKPPTPRTRRTKRTTTTRVSQRSLAGAAPRQRLSRSVRDVVRNSQMRGQASGLAPRLAIQSSTVESHRIAVMPALGRAVAAAIQLAQDFLRYAQVKGADSRQSAVAVGGNP